MKVNVSIPNGLPRPFSPIDNLKPGDHIAIVSIPNGLPRPFSRYLGGCSTGSIVSFNPERAPQAI